MIFHNYVSLPEGSVFCSLDVCIVSVSFTLGLTDEQKTIQTKIGSNGLTLANCLLCKRGMGFLITPLTGTLTPDVWVKHHKRQNSAHGAKRGDHSHLTIAQRSQPEVCSMIFAVSRKKTYVFFSGNMTYDSTIFGHICCSPERA